MTLSEGIMTPWRGMTRVCLRPELILTRIAIAMGLSLMLTIPAYLVDDRVFQGENVWLKPIKFQLALAIYFATLAVYASWLPKEFTKSTRLRNYLAVIGFVSIAEMIWIGGAAMFATASHYNTQPLFYAIYALMGVFAFLLTSVSLVFGWAFWRDTRSALPHVVRLSLALGLILTFVLTLIVAGTLSSLPGHHIGTPSLGITVPLMGWSREVGDLRVPHFFATHALHVIPLIGLAAFGLLQARQARLAVWTGAVIFVAFTLFTFIQALNGRPFL